MYGWLVAVIASTISNNDAFIVTFRNSMLDTRRYLSVHEVSADTLKVEILCLIDLWRRKYY